MSGIIKDSEIYIAGQGRRQKVTDWLKSCAKYTFEDPWPAEKQVPILTKVAGIEDASARKLMLEVIQQAQNACRKVELAAAYFQDLTKFMEDLDRDVDQHIQRIQLKQEAPQ